MIPLSEIQGEVRTITTNTQRAQLRDEAVPFVILIQSIGWLPVLHEVPPDKKYPPK
jgi:hypothetical protein